MSLDVAGCRYYHSCNYNGVIIIMARIPAECKGESVPARVATRID